MIFDGVLWISEIVDRQTFASDSLSIAVCTRFDCREGSGKTYPEAISPTSPRERFEIIYNKIQDHIQQDSRSYTTRFKIIYNKIQDHLQQDSRSSTTRFKIIYNKIRDHRQQSRHRRTRGFAIAFARRRAHEAVRKNKRTDSHRMEQGRVRSKH
jgi:hypothetical protein